MAKETRMKPQDAKAAAKLQRARQRYANTEAALRGSRDGLSPEDREAFNEWFFRASITDADELYERVKAWPLRISVECARAIGMRHKLERDQRAVEKAQA